MNDGAVRPAERVLDLFQGARLTPTQRRIAHSLVQHAPNAAYLSAAEVAELAGVSQPSVTRFAMALGYSGYPALRRELRALTDDAPAEPAARNRSRCSASARSARCIAFSGAAGGGTAAVRARSSRRSAGYPG